jgi:hypothetical protein
VRRVRVGVEDPHLEDLMHEAVKQAPSQRARVRAGTLGLRQCGTKAGPVHPLFGENPTAAQRRVGPGHAHRAGTRGRGPNRGEVAHLVAQVEFFVQVLSESVCQSNRAHPPGPTRVLLGAGGQPAQDVQVTLDMCFDARS